MKIQTTEMVRRAIRILFLFNGIILLLTSCTKSPAMVNEAARDVPISKILMAKDSRPLNDVTFEATPERLSRGKYLTHGLHCIDCHTERDETKPGHPPILEKKFSGALRYRTDSTWLYAPNLTPDKETGIGTFTDDMIARALREGVGHDGRSLVPPGRYGMPWRSFRYLSDEDMASIICYLRSIPAIKNEIPKRNIGDKVENAIVGRSNPLFVSVPEPDHSDPLSVGTYLVRLGHCMGCHTNWGRHNSGVYGGGLNFTEDENEPLFSANISSSKTGIGKWSKEAFIHVLKTGKNGVLSPHMPWTSYKNLTDEDLGAIFDALMTTFPIDHAVLNRVPLTYCKSCDREHGLGDQNHREPFRSFESHYKIPEDLAGTYFNRLYVKDTFRIFYEEGKLLVNNKSRQLIPISESTYVSDVLFAPIMFKRNQEGLVTGFSFQNLEENDFQKINR